MFGASLGSKSVFLETLKQFIRVASTHRATSIAVCRKVGDLIRGFKYRLGDLTFSERENTMRV